MNKDRMIHYLKHFVVTFTFRKSDGSDRTMVGTLKENLLPPKDTQSVRVQTTSETLIHVYDLENKGWRSFHINTLIPDSVSIKTDLVLE